MVPNLAMCAQAYPAAPTHQARGVQDSANEYPAAPANAVRKTLSDMQRSFLSSLLMLANIRLLPFASGTDGLKKWSLVLWSVTRAAIGLQAGCMSAKMQVDVVHRVLLCTDENLGNLVTLSVNLRSSLVIDTVSVHCMPDLWCVDPRCDMN